MSKDHNSTLRMFLVTGEPFLSLTQEYKDAMEARRQALYDFCEPRGFGKVLFSRWSGKITGVQPKDYSTVENPPPGWKVVGKTGERGWSPHENARNKAQREAGIEIAKQLEALPGFPETDAIAKAAGIPSDVVWETPGGAGGSEMAGSIFSMSSGARVYWSGPWTFITGPNTDEQVAEIRKEHPDAVFSHGLYPDPVPAGLQRISWEEYGLYLARHKVAEYERKQKALAEGQPFEEEGEL